MVKRFTAVLMPLLFLCVAVSAFALGNKDGSKPQKVEVSGIVRLVGNSPFSSLVISGEDREWYIVPEEQKKLMDLQHQMVTVRGQEYYYDRTFANGTSAGRQYYLKKIVIVKQKFPQDHR
jgi:hypothetical protein